MNGGGDIRIGVGGWTFAPWRGVFYPASLPQKDELSHASRRLTAIEINATYYGGQKPATYRKWACETPDDFLFTIKGSRFTTNRRVLAEAGESITRFFDQGLAELGPKLGPVLWQFAPTKRFEPDDFAAFLALLPASLDGVRLRHCVEVRHPSFNDPAFAALLRQTATPVVFTDHETFPNLADVTGDFIYARLQAGSDEIATAYPSAELDAWSARLRTWAQGGVPTDLNRADPDFTPKRERRDVFAFIIHEGKMRAPAGAEALIDRIRR